MRLCLGVLLFLCLQVEAAPEGYLTVLSTPPGIEVWLDGHYAGNTPITEKKLEAGRYTVKLVDPVQHASISETVLIESGEKVVLERTVKPRFGTLSVTSEPEGAEVYLATPLGTTPLTNTFMTPGRYRVEIRHPNPLYKPSVQHTMVPKGDKATVSASLEPHNALNRKAMIRLGCGAAALGGFIWALVEQNNVGMYNAYLDQPTSSIEQQKEWEDNRKAASVRRTLGVILGSVSVVAFEVVAFF
jgi:hypothetical protein